MITHDDIFRSDSEYGWVQDSLHLVPNVSLRMSSSPRPIAHMIRVSSVETCPGQRISTIIFCDANCRYTADHHHNNSKRKTFCIESSLCPPSILCRRLFSITLVVAQTPLFCCSTLEWY